MPQCIHRPQLPPQCPRGACRTSILFFRSFHRSLVCSPMQTSSLPARGRLRSGLGLSISNRLRSITPRGTGSSFTSFTSSKYSPVHGQSIRFSATVTSGTGGAFPTGTISFVTTTGATLGTVNLIGGTATYTSITLSGGTYVVRGTYSGDGIYASSSSPVGTVLVQAEASQLAAALGTGNTIGRTFTVLVMATAASGVGTPSGTESVVISGTSQTGTGVLVASGIKRLQSRSRLLLNQLMDRPYPSTAPVIRISVAIVRLRKEFRSGKRRQLSILATHPVPRCRAQISP